MNKKVFIGGPISHLMSESGFDEGFVKIHMKVMQMLKQAGYQILSAHIVEDYGKKKIEPDAVIFYVFGIVTIQISIHRCFVECQSKM